MKIKIIKIGKIAHKEILPLVGEYEKRLKVLTQIESVEFKSLNPKMEKQILDHDYIIALDERGVEWSSTELAKKISQWQDNPKNKTICFVIGDPYGLTEEIRRKAHIIWSLSRLTLSSDIAWLLVWEQVYRGFSIIKGIKYHHE